MKSAPSAADEEPDPVPQPGDVIAEKYCVDEVVGVGGMGVVLAARHLQLGQRVAIKVLRASEANREEATARFLREGKAAAGLSSDHVVRIHDVGTLPSGAAFMVMELLRGRDLSAHLTAVGPLQISQAVDFILQVCDAIAEAHAFGIIHRDLKPSNLFLTHRSDGTELVKVLDFGISKALATGKGTAYDGTLTSTRTVIGSPAYMSPEQIRDAKHVDHRVDVWAIGLILYEFLAGRQAFAADTLPAVCAAIAADTPAPLVEVRPEVPVELSNIVCRCLEKDPARRFQTIRELGDALEPFGRHHRYLSPMTTTAPAPPRADGNRGSAPSLSQDTLASGERERISATTEATLASAAPSPVLEPRPGLGAWLLLLAAVGIVAATVTAVLMLWRSPAPAAGAELPSADVAGTARAATSPGDPTQAVVPEILPIPSLAIGDASATASATPRGLRGTPWQPRTTATPTPSDASVAAPDPEIRLHR